MEDQRLTAEQIRKRQQEEEKEREIRSILLKADDNKEEAVTFDEEDRLAFKNEVEGMLDTPIDDPKEKYELYYHVIDKVLRERLPKGKDNETARNYIYEEKNTFLTRGNRKDAKGIRHADSRMGYNPDMRELAEAVTDWALSQGTMFDLYTKLRELNKSKGYPLE